MLRWPMGLGHSGRTLQRLLMRAEPRVSDAIDIGHWERGRRDQGARGGYRAPPELLRLRVIALRCNHREGCVHT